VDWRHARALCFVSVLMFAAACAPPERGTAGRGAVLYVANATDRTVTRLDAASGRSVGPPIAIAHTPAFLVAGSDGRFLAATPPGVIEGAATLVTVDTQGHATTRPLPLGSAAQILFAAGDGRSSAALVYRPWEGEGPSRRSGGCRLAVVDLAVAALTHTYELCQPGEEPTGLALPSGAGNALAYVGMWRSGSPGSARSGEAGAGTSTGGSIVEVDTASGARRTVVALEGAPGLLSGSRSTPPSTPSPAAMGGRLCFVETVPGPLRPAQDWRDVDPVITRWRLIVLDTGSRGVAAVYPLPFPPLALDLSAGQQEAYVLGHEDSPTRTTLLAGVDLTSGAMGRPFRLRGTGLSLAVSGEVVFVPNAAGAEVWAVNLPKHQLERSVPAGRQPVAVAIGASG